MVKHFSTVLIGFVVGLRRRTINLWDMPAPDTEYATGTEMRIDNGQTSLRAMLQYVCVALRHVVALRCAALRCAAPLHRALWMRTWTLMWTMV